MAKITNVELEFPMPPKVSDRPEKQEQFERWYYDFKTTILRQFEALQTQIDEVNNAK